MDMRLFLAVCQALTKFPERPKVVRTPRCKTGPPMNVAPHLCDISRTKQNTSDLNTQVDKTMLASKGQAGSQTKLLRGDPSTVVFQNKETKLSVRRGNKTSIRSIIANVVDNRPERLAKVCPSIVVPLVISYVLLTIARQLPLKSGP